MDPNALEIMDCITRLERGEQTPEDVQAIAAYVRQQEQKLEFMIEMLSASRDRWLRTAAELGNPEAAEWLRDREVEIATWASESARVEVGGNMRWDIPIDAMFCKCDFSILGADSQTCKNCGRLVVE